MKGEDIITFGKYNGKTASVLSEDKGYVNYILNTFEDNERNRELLQYLRSLSIQSPNPTTVTGLVKKFITSLRGDFNRCKYLLPKNTESIKTFEVPNDVKIMFNLLRKINASFAGIFVDYLFRFVVCKIFNQKFEDDKITSIITNPNKNIFILHGESEEEINFKEIFDSIEHLNINNAAKNIFYLSLTHSLSYSSSLVESEVISFVKILDSDPNFFVNFIQYSQNFIDFWQDEFTVEKWNSNTLYYKNEMGETLFTGSPDILFTNEIVDIKLTQSEFPIYEKLQILTYASIARSNGREIESASIMNLYHGKIYTLDLSEWDESNLISTLSSSSSPSKREEKKCGSFGIHFLLGIGGILLGAGVGYLCGSIF